VERRRCKVLAPRLRSRFSTPALAPSWSPPPPRRQNRGRFLAVGGCSEALYVVSMSPQQVTVILGNRQDQSSVSVEHCRALPTFSYAFVFRCTHPYPSFVFIRCIILLAFSFLFYFYSLLYALESCLLYACPTKRAFSLLCFR
jgi:hypothetical protein